MTRFFFDVTTKEQSLFDYRGHEFRTPEGAVDFAESMVQRLEHSLNESWRGWSIEIRNAQGNRLFSFPVGQGLQAA
jgi:hypothetical protein